MTRRYRVYYTVFNEYEMVVNANSEKEAKDIVELKIDPDNQYDWTHIRRVEVLPNDQKR